MYSTIKTSHKSAKSHHQSHGRKVAMRSFYNVRPNTPAENKIELLKDMADASRILGTGVSVFTLVFCGLNWITYRRMAAAAAEEEAKNKK